MHEKHIIEHFVACLAKERDNLASVMQYADVRLRYVPKLTNGSEADAEHAELWRLLHPLLKLYDDNHHGPPVPAPVRFMGFLHITNVTITVSGAKYPSSVQPRKRKHVA